MSISRGLASAFALSLALAACGSSSSSPSSDFSATPYATFDVGALSVELRTAPTQPPTRGVIGAELRVHDAAGAPKDGLAIDVVPWMVAHGHGSSVIPLVTPMGDGVYRIDRIQLAMPGTWQLRFSMKAADLDAQASTMLEVQ